MKKIIKFILLKISRVIFWITPREFTPPPKKSILQIKLDENLYDETFNHFKEHIKQSILFDNNWKVREYAIKTSLLNDKNKEFYYLEFGTWRGRSANFFSKYVKKLYVFDSFEGLKEDWVGTNKPKGYFNLNKKIPTLNSNVEPNVGWVEDTLEDFLKKHNPKINFVHLDMDNFSPTKFTLEKIKPYLVKDAIILFDELYNYLGWEEGEYKALNEVFSKDEYRFKSFNLKGVNSCIQIK
jgi:hypothetical protein